MNPGPISKKAYVVVWAILMLLLLLTWGLAQLDLGVAGTPIALLIAGIKMLLVILIFMQVRHHSRSIWVFAAAGFFWFSIMVALTLGDYLTREKVQPPYPPTAHYQSHVVEK